MKRSRLSVWLLPIISLAVGGAMAILLATALGNPAPVYLSDGLVAAFWISLTILLLTSAVFAFVFPTPSTDTDKPPVLPTRIASLLALCGIGFFVGSQIVNAIKMLGTAGQTLPAVCLLLSGILAIGGGVYVFFPAVFAKRGQLTTSLSGLSFVLSIIFYVLHLYFDVTYAKNGTMKQMLSIAFLFAVLYLLADIRKALGRNEIKFYRIASPVAGALAFSVSLGGVIYFLRAGTFPFGGAAPYVFLLFFFLYIYITFLGDAMAENSDNNESEDEE